jgi:hypothetical protein
MKTGFDEILPLEQTLLSVQKKEKCPTDCPFKNRVNLKPAVVPPPDDIEAVIVSSDPTTGWLPTYLYATQWFDEPTRRRVLYASAIPGQLIARISEFLDWDLTDQTDQARCTKLSSFIYEKTYWTHRHKCHTDVGDDAYKFKKGIAQECAATWLKDEIDGCESIKFIVALSGLRQDWFDRTGLKENLIQVPKDIEVIKLYHTSPRNRRLWCGEKKADERIDRLKKQNRTKQIHTYKEQRKDQKEQLERFLKLVKIP